MQAHQVHMRDSLDRDRSKEEVVDCDDDNALGNIVVAAFGRAELCKKTSMKQNDSQHLVIPTTYVKQLQQQSSM